MRYDHLRCLRERSVGCQGLRRGTPTRLDIVTSELPIDGSHKHLAPRHVNVVSPKYSNIQSKSLPTASLLIGGRLLTVDSDVAYLLRLALTEFRSGFSGGNDLGLVRVRISVLFGVTGHLGLELGHATRGGDQSEEGRRGVQRSGAELGMGLETDKVGVIYQEGKCGV